jgi:hypothetical protein
MAKRGGKNKNILLSQISKQTALALLSNFNVNSANGTTIAVPRSNLDPVVFVPIIDVKFVGFATPRTVPVHVSNLGFTVIYIKTSGCSRRRVGTTTGVDIDRAAWRCCLLVDVRTGDFVVLVSVLVPLAPYVLLEKRPVALHR